MNYTNTIKEANYVGFGCLKKLNVIKGNSRDNPTSTFCSALALMKYFYTATSRPTDIGIDETMPRLTSGRVVKIEERSRYFLLDTAISQLPLRNRHRQTHLDRVWSWSVPRDVPWPLRCSWTSAEVAAVVVSCCWTSNSRRPMAELSTRCCYQGR